MESNVLDKASKVEWVKAAEWIRRHPGVFGRDTFYSRVRDGSIPCLRVGRTVLVPDNLLERMMAEAGKRDE
jgi:hypothetical protein